MLIPLSWLKEFVDIKLPFPQLAEKLSAAGLTVEKWEEKDGDIIFDPEITPNRPDWMSVFGIARETAAICNSKLKKDDPFFKGSSFSKVFSKVKNPLPITIKPNYDIVPRITSVVIKNVKVKPSPEWMQKRIKQIGLRPINNLVDITNYVLWTYGGLLHVFDYDKIRGHQMTVELSKGGEDFRSLDGIDYKLPKGAIIIKDLGRVIDLLPIKGGENTASKNDTKNVLLHSVVVDPTITRRTSQALGLRSDSSAIAERGLDPNITTISLNTALNLILELSGGEVASEIIDHKSHDFKPWTVELSHSRLEQVLGIKISPTEVKNILERLGLKVEDQYKVTVPTYRNDIHIEEDLIEEVARIYGYNNFPKSLPASAVPTTPVAYARNYDLEYDVKTHLRGAGYCEIYTYSLIPEKQLLDLSIDPTKCLRVDNPISRDFEYLRPYFIGNHLEALNLNQPNFQEIKLFELGKAYTGESIDKFTEKYRLEAIISGDKFFQAKGDVESLLQKLGIAYTVEPIQKEKLLPWDHPGRTVTIVSNKTIIAIIFEIHPTILTRFGIKSKAVSWSIQYELVEKLNNLNKKFQPIPKHPAVIEDLSLIIPEETMYGDVVEIIKKTSPLIASIDLLDTHESSKTLRLTYLDRTKNLTDNEVAQIRSKLLQNLKVLKVRTK